MPRKNSVKEIGKPDRMTMNSSASSTSPSISWLMGVPGLVWRCSRQFAHFRRLPIIDAGAQRLEALDDFREPLQHEQRGADRDNGLVPVGRRAPRRHQGFAQFPRLLREV